MPRTVPTPPAKWNPADLKQRARAARRPCLMCDTMFKATTHHQDFCSTACRKAHQNFMMTLGAKVLEAGFDWCRDRKNLGKLTGAVIDARDQFFERRKQVQERKQP